MHLKWDEWLTNWWAITALLQNALVTSTDDHSALAIFWSRTLTSVVPVISSSLELSKPQIWGMYETSELSFFKETSINQSWGIEAFWRVRLSRICASQCKLAICTEETGSLHGELSLALIIIAYMMMSQMMTYTYTDESSVQSMIANGFVHTVSS